MASLQKATTTLVNIGLVGLLAASWAASRYPHLAAFITIGSSVAAVGLAAVLWFLPRLNRSGDLGYHEENIAETSVEHIEDKSPDGEDVQQSTAEGNLGQVDWSNLLKHWNGDFHSSSVDQDVFNNLIKRMVHHSSVTRRHQQSLNIGVVNLIFTDGAASIKQWEAAKTNTKQRDQKIDVQLRPDLNLEGEKIN